MSKKQFRIVVFGFKGGCGKSTLVAILLDVLKLHFNLNVDVVEIDSQESLSNAVSVGFMSRHIPVKEKDAKGGIVIYDTPGYKDVAIDILLQKADIILMPTMLAQKDLTAFIQAVSENSDGILISRDLRKKTWVIFNRIRRPHNSLYKKYKPMFIDYIKSIGDINVAKTELSAINPFEDITGQDQSPLNDSKTGAKALKEAINLIKELPIKLHA